MQIFDTNSCKLVIGGKIIFEKTSIETNDLQSIYAFYNAMLESDVDIFIQPIGKQNITPGDTAPGVKYELEWEYISEPV